MSSRGRRSSVGGCGGADTRYCGCVPEEEVKMDLQWDLQWDLQRGPLCSW